MGISPPQANRSFDETPLPDPITFHSRVASYKPVNRVPSSGGCKDAHAFSSTLEG